MLHRMEPGFGTRERRRVTEASWVIALLLTLLPSPVAAQYFFNPYCPPVSPGPFGPWPPPAMQPYAVSAPPVWVTAPQTVTAASVSPIAGNLFLEITEDFANCVVSRETSHGGPVRDFVLGANVYGDQMTRTETRIDFQPDEQQAHWSYTLSGLINNRTVGVTPQAMVHTEGHHQMRIVKEIYFDGEQFSTRSPAAYITPRLRHVGAVTQAAGMPIVGPISGNIALRAAEMRRPEAERLAAYRVTEGAAPAFNSRIDAELTRLNQQLQNTVRPWLVRGNLLPDEQHLRTTDQSLQWQVQLRSPETGDAAGSLAVPPPAESRGRAATLVVHESLLNAAVARQPLAGLELSTTEIARRLEALPGANAAPRESNTPAATLLFPAERAVVFRFDKNQCEIVVRMGLRTAIGPELPLQEIVIPFRVDLTPDAVHFRPGEVTIRHADPGTQSGTLDEVARQLIRSEIQGRLMEHTLPRQFTLPLDGTDPVTLRIRGIEFANGCLTVSLD